MINGPVAHQMEALNAASTINLLECVVLFALARPPNSMPNHIALKELHRSGTIFLLHKPGEYRDCPVVVVEKNTGVAIYNPPAHADVPRHMDEFFNELFQLGNRGDALDVAAFALWKINWVHPFKNGNGRTARAFAYACLCVKLGAVLPGSPTVIDQIMTNRPEYEACIREGDASHAAGNLNLARMKTYLDGLLQIQIQSARTFSP
jgi:Fic family protein